MKKLHVSGAIAPCLWCNSSMSLVFSEGEKCFKTIKTIKSIRKAAMATPPPFLLMEQKTAKK